VSTTVIATHDSLAAGPDTVLTVRPRYEGSNICTWIGFKHVNYMIEEAVLTHLRERGRPAGELYERYGLCTDIVHLDTKILHAFHIDDVATAVVRPAPVAGDGRLDLMITLTVERDGATVRAAKAKVGISLRRDPRGWPAEPVPDDLAPLTVDRLGPVVPVAKPEADSIDGLLKDSNGFGWVARMPYFYCHFTERVQMSGYLRQMEEALDLFMADRGASIKRMLDEQNWIPVVPHSSITLLDEAAMEEDLYTVFTVEEVYKRFTFTARMDCYVKRDGVLVPTATGRITHGWALIENRRDWRLVDFDDRLLNVVNGAVPSRAADR
jgi:acyl-CoA thioesterase FadM